MAGKLEATDRKMACARRHRAKKVRGHKSGSGTDVIRGLEEFSKPDRKLNHSPLWEKREYADN